MLTEIITGILKAVMAAIRANTLPADEDSTVTAKGKETKKYPECSNSSGINNSV